MVHAAVLYTGTWARMEGGCIDVEVDTNYDGDVCLIAATAGLVNILEWGRIIEDRCRDLAGWCIKKLHRSKVAVEGHARARVRASIAAYWTDADVAWTWPIEPTSTRNAPGTTISLATKTTPAKATMR